MSRASSRKQQQSLTHFNTTTIPPNVPDDILVDDNEDDTSGDAVTSHIYLKPTPAAGTLDKQVVLRRIRHRKRMNMVKSTINSLFATATAGASSPNKFRWVDDPFAAP